jgi:hypothetical protein
VPSIALPDSMTWTATPVVIMEAAVEAPSATHRQARAWRASMTVAARLVRRMTSASGTPTATNPSTFNASTTRRAPG